MRQGKAWKKLSTPIIFYGWVVVGVSFLTVALAYGVRYSFSVFYLAILDEFGWGRASTAAIFSINMLVYGLVAPLVGALIDRFGPRRVISVGTSLVAFGALLSSQAGQVWHLYLSFGLVMGLGVSFAGYPAHVPILSNWFSRRRATALGIGLAGIGISYLVAPVAQYLISQIGWRSAYAVLAGAVLVTTMPLVLLLQRTKPHNMGLLPDGEAASHAANSGMDADAGDPRQEWTLRQAMRTPQFWLLFAASFLSAGIGLSILLAHQVRYAVDAGYSEVLAAAVFGLWGLAYAGGLASGFLADLIERKWVYIMTCLLVLVAMVMLLWAGTGISAWKLYFYAILFGYGVGLNTPACTAITADLFHGRNFGQINAFANSLAFGLGGGVGPWLAGWIFETGNSYLPAFLLSMAAWSMAAFCIWRVAARTHRRLPESSS